MISAKVLADSIAPNGARLTTLEVVLPMFVQPQLLRHRAFSFSVQSTRAVPLAEQIRRVREQPCEPLRWGAAQRGMVADEEVAGKRRQYAVEHWQLAAAKAAGASAALEELGIHQEVAARLLAPFQWCRCIVSATEWDNFFALRIDSHAQAEIRAVAEAIRDAREASTPVQIGAGDWHLPLVDDADRVWAGMEPALRSRIKTGSSAMAAYCDLLRLISAGRCARVSFLQHDGKRNTERDAMLGERLASEAHWSALEHQATPLPAAERCGNFVGWAQLRKHYLYEDNRAAWLASKGGES